LGGLGSDLYPAFGTAFHVGIIALRIAAVMPVIGCLGLRLGLRHLLLYVNRRRGRDCDYRGGRVAIPIPSVPVSAVPISIDRGTVICGTAAVITQAQAAQ
jgi:hypothetical protein